jgi:hypothetical protein
MPPPPQQSGFRFQAKYALLTYAQCDGLSVRHLADHLGTLGAKYVIGRENHADGGIHFHAFIDFGRKYDSRNVRVFDVDGHHPNILVGHKTPEAMFDYATKDGDIVEQTMERPTERGVGTQSSASKWSDIVGTSLTRQDFFEKVAELDPRALCCSFGNIQKYADWRYAEPDPEYTGPTTGWVTDEYPELDTWVAASITGYEPGVR